MRIHRNETVAVVGESGSGKSVTASGQLRTRFQAFVESIEIKKIQEGK